MGGGRACKEIPPSVQGSTARVQAGNKSSYKDASLIKSAWSWHSAARYANRPQWCIQLFLAGSLPAWLWWFDSVSWHSKCTVWKKFIICMVPVIGKYATLAFISHMFDANFILHGSHLSLHQWLISLSSHPFRISDIHRLSLYISHALMPSWHI